MAHAVLGQSWVISEESELLADLWGSGCNSRVIFVVDWWNHRTKFSILNQTKAIWRLSLQQDRVSQITRSPITPAKQTVVGSRRTVAAMACAGTEPAFHNSCEPVALDRK